MSEDVLGYLLSKGLDMRKAGGSEFHTSCFFQCPPDPKKKKLYINCDPEADIPGLFTCFVCGEKGALPTIMRHFGDDPKPETINADNRRAILESAAGYYADQIRKHDDVLEYLEGDERKLLPETIVDRRLGYAAMELSQEIGGGVRRERSRSLYYHLRKAGFDPGEVKATGLIVDANGTLVDSFQNMITIPYFVAGHVVQIRGRAFPYTKEHKDKGLPKYKTCGGNQARLYNTDTCWGQDQVILTEGEFDAMVIEQLGEEFHAIGSPGAKVWQDVWNDTVAPLKRLFVCFDRDNAGETAAADIQARFGGKVRRIFLSPEGVKIDPTQWVAAGHTADDFAQIVRDAGRGSLLITVAEAMLAHAEIQDLPGLKFGDEVLDLSIDPGLQASQVMVILAKTGTGKNEPVNSLIPTPDGYTKIGDLRVGDRVFGRNGKSTRVQGVFPQGVRRTMTMSFSDGTSRTVGAEHLWEVHYRYGHRRDWTPTVMTTEEILAAGLKHGKEWKFRIPMCEPLERTPRELPIQPYTMGTYLANGTGLQTSAVITTPDEEVVARMRTEHQVNAHKVFECPRFGLPGMIGEIRLLGLDVHSSDKFIPEPYLLGSVEQRVALLQGLMDGDGTSSSKGRRCVRYSTTSRRLASDLVELVTSLGGTAVENWSDRSLEGKPWECNLTIMLPEQIEPFSSSRKRQGAANPRYQTVPHRAIVAIEEVDPEDSVCISVEADDQLYVSGREHVVTHNTIMALNWMHSIITYPGQEDKKILFISLEQTRGEWWERARRIATFHDIERSDADVAKLWENNIMIVDKNRLNEDEFGQCIDDFEYEQGKKPDLVVVDYLGYWARSFRGEAYERTSEAIMSLKGMAKDHMVPVITPHQVSRVGKDGEEFGADAARDSGVVEETADFLLTMWSPDNTLGRTPGEMSGQVKLRIGKSRHGGRGQMLEYQFAPISLAMVPLRHPRGAAARDELNWKNTYHDTWRQAVYRHKYGVEGMLTGDPFVNGPPPDQRKRLYTPDDGF